MKDLILTIITSVVSLLMLDGASLYLMSAGHITIYGAGFLITLITFWTVFVTYAIMSEYRQYKWHKEYIGK